MILIAGLDAGALSSMYGAESCVEAANVAISGTSLKGKADFSRFSAVSAQEP